MKIYENTKFVKSLTADRFWVIGDIHGMYDHMVALIAKIANKQALRNEKFEYVFTGDLTDRGDKSLEVLNFFIHDFPDQFTVVHGNHDNRLLRYMNGSHVQHTHGLEKTIEGLSKCSIEELEQIKQFLYSMPITVEMTIPGNLEGGVVAHAAFDPKFFGYQNKWSPKHTMQYAIYGPTNGMNPNGLPNRIEWENTYDDMLYYAFYGHRIIGNVPKITSFTCGVDTGCFESGILTAVSYPDREVIQVTNEDI